MGPINPVEVQNTLQQYHAFVLPSKGENFGHAIYEALSVGRPVIISEFTPWSGLKAKAAGWNCALTTKELYTSIKELKRMNQEEFDSYCKNAIQVANKYYLNSINLISYHKLFNLEKL
jgi:hypothetical protein